MELPIIWLYAAGEVLLLVVLALFALSYNLAKAKARIRDLMQKLRERQITLNTAENRHSQSQSNLHRLMAELKGLKNSSEEETQDIEIAHNETSKERDNLKIQLRQAQLDLKSKTTELNQKIRQLEARDGVVNDDDNDEKPTHNQPLKEVHSRSRGELDRLKQTAADQRKLIADLRNELSDNLTSDNDDDDKDPTLDRLERLLGESETIIQMLESELDEMQHQVDLLDKKLNDAESNNELVTPELAPSLEEFDQLQAQLEQATASLAEAASRPSLDELEQLQNQLDEALNNSDSPTPSSPPASDAELEQLQAQLEATNDMAMTMMKVNGDQSNVITFARNAINCHSAEDLSDAIINMADNYGIKGVVQIRAQSGTVNRSDAGNPSADDLIALSDTSSDDRFETIDDNILIRFDHISLLLKELPDDEDQRSRYKENIAIGLELAVAEAESIDADHAKLKQQALLKKLVASTAKTIQDVEKKFVRQADDAKMIMDSLTGVLNTEAFIDQLDPTFKIVFTGILEENKERFDKVYDKGAAIDATFSNIINSLKDKL